MTTPARLNEETGVPYHFKAYTSFASDIDLLADGPTNIESRKGKMPCRRILVLASGTTGAVVLTRTDDTDITITGLAAGQTLDLQAVKIKASGTTITNALVEW